MRVEEAINIIEDLSKGQGFYGRVLERIDEFNDDEMKSFEKFVEPLKDPVDLVMAFEQ